MGWQVIDRNKHILNIFGTWQITDEIFFNIKRGINLNYLIIRVNRIFHNIILWLLASNSPYTYYVHRFTMMLMNSGTRQICTKIQKRDIERRRERERERKISAATIIENNTTKATIDVFAYKLTNTNYVTLSLLPFSAFLQVYIWRYFI